MSENFLSQTDKLNSVDIDLTADIHPLFLKAALSIEKTLHENGFEAFLVGGSVRDLLIKKKISDLDYTTNAVPATIKKIFKKVIPVGEEFGTVIVLIGKTPIEITTYRTDGNYKDGRRPESISFGKNLHEDVMRRDFTINGMAYSVTAKKLIDYTNGMHDLKARIISTIGDPIKRFEEDGLRPIRGCRIMSNLGFEMDPDTEAAIPKKLHIIAKVAPERFYDEWRKTLNLRAKDVYWNSLKKTGIFKLFFTEFENLNNNPDNWNDLLLAIQHSRPGKMAVYIAHFFYFEWHSQDNIALDHSKTFDQFIKKFFRRNRFPSKTETLCKDLLFSPLIPVFEKSVEISVENSHDTILKNHQNNPIDKINFKKALSKIKQNNWFYHFRFSKEIILSKLRHEHKESIYTNIGQQTISLLKTIIKNKEPIYLTDLAISGHQLIDLGYKGKQIGEILATLQSKVIEQPELNEKGFLIETVKKI